MKRLIAFGVLLTSTFCMADYKGPSPWTEVRKDRIDTLLPAALTKANVDAWMVICRENNNDPLADHVGCENAGAPAVYIFYFD